MQRRAERSFVLRAQGPEYVAAFYNVMPRCLKQALQTGDDKTKDKVRKHGDHHSRHAAVGGQHRFREWRLRAATSAPLHIDGGDPAECSPGATL